MTKDDVLELLEMGDFVSGQKMSESLGITRAAVWKAIQQLRTEGYGIDSVTNRGYRLTSRPDLLSRPGILRCLGEHPWRDRLVVLDSVDSTNTYAKKLALAGSPDGTVVISNNQTAGRGRMGRTFQSPRDKGIYLTVLLRPNLPPERLMPVTAMAGVAVCDAVEQVCGVRPGLKWPNDPVIGGRKLCGILTELSLEGETGRVQYLVLGIGVNVSQQPEDFPPDVAEIATSLSAYLGREVSRPQLAAAMVRELERLYTTLLSGDLSSYLASYRQGCVNLGKTVQLLGDGKREVVTALDIDPDFGLVVRTETGEEKVVRSGEVSVRGMYGYVES